jgi:ribosomal protein L37AE/L43A
VSKNFPKSGKKTRPKTAIQGKRYLCAKCRKRSPRPVKTPAPWYCPRCLEEQASLASEGPPEADGGRPESDR